MIPVVEVFGDTIQGEGKLIGKPAIFVRTFGCNLNCRGFGMPAGQLSNEADEIMRDPINQQAKFIKELPLAKTGCDSYPAIHPLCARLATRYEESDLCDKICELAEVGVIKKYEMPLIVFTGGEPLLHKKRIDILMQMLVRRGFHQFMFETNGTIPVDEFDVLKEPGNEILFSVSPKLSNSGNIKSIAFKPEAIKSYCKVGETYLKFVVDKEADLAEVNAWVESFNWTLLPEDDKHLEVFLMPEGGVLDDRSRANAKRVAELCWKYGYRFSPREHLTVFGNAWAK